MLKTAYGCVGEAPGTTPGITGNVSGVTSDAGAVSGAAGAVAVFVRLGWVVAVVSAAPELYRKSNRTRPCGESES